MNTFLNCKCSKSCTELPKSSIKKNEKRTVVLPNIPFGSLLFTRVIDSADLKSGSSGTDKKIIGNVVLQYACTDPENIRSNRVLEKCGYIHIAEQHLFMSTIYSDGNFSGKLTYFCAPILKTTRSMDQFLEILKYTIPSLVVFAAAYYTLKTYLDAHYRDQVLRMKAEALKITLPVRLQAFERLILLCDRMAMQNLLLRIRSANMTVGELKAALMIAIAQEFDHNTSQQLYVSEMLWQIISLAKSDTIGLVMKAAEGLDNDAPDEKLINNIFGFLDQLGDVTSLQKAQMAIRTEAGQIF